jgi:hypothetical protein
MARLLPTQVCHWAAIEPFPKAVVRRAAAPTASRRSLPFQGRGTMPETDRSFMRGGIYIVCLRACIGTIGVGFGDKPDPQFSAIHADGLDEVALAGA